MARPKKQEVDYFPHYCDHGKVLFILENHFKNDGYAVFYKLEELLAKTEGHCYDCSLLENWEFMLSRMGTTEEIVTGVIEKLSAMGVIDAPLWKEKRIWMQSFVDSISDVYARRKVDLPIKPGLSSTEIPLSGINDNRNPQSKVKESKVKESKARKQKTPLPENFNISPAVYQWAKNKGHTRIEEHYESFKAKCRANGYEYIDWDSAFMEAIRADWAKLKSTGGNSNAGIRTSRTDPRDKSLQSREDAEVAAITAKWEAAKASACDKAGGTVGNDDAPDFSREQS